MALETITEAFCGWPYYQPYVFTRKIPRIVRPRKARTKKGATPKRRSPIASDLFTPKYAKRVVPNKKRKAKAPAVTLEV